MIPISFARLAAEYPDHMRFPAKDLLDTVGGQVRATVRDIDNTCAIRLSWTLNHAGLPIQQVQGVKLFKAAPRQDPNTLTWVRPTTLHELYMIRVVDVKRYITARYGPGLLIWDGRSPTSFKAPITGATRGIVVFDWLGAYSEFHASGHATLLRTFLTHDKPPQLQPVCQDQCYWQPGRPMLAYLWETQP